MAFGKRPLSVPTAVAKPAAAALPPVRPSEERHLELRDIMLRILKQTGAVAEAIRTNGTLILSGIADEIDPLASPIELRDLPGHFSFSDGQTLLHPFFGYANAEKPNQIDPSAQFQILALVGRIRDINRHCQDGNNNEALGVALQSPHLPNLVDRILAPAAFFAAYFENLATTQAFVTGAAQGRPLPDFARLKSVHDRHKLMAYDCMLSPESVDLMLPTAVWPHVGVEIARRNEAGEQFVHGVYFPAAYARQLVERAGHVPRDSDLVLA